MAYLYHGVNIEQIALKGPNDELIVRDQRWWCYALELRASSDSGSSSVSNAPIVEVDPMAHVVVVAFRGRFDEKAYALAKNDTWRQYKWS